MGVGVQSGRVGEKSVHNVHKSFHNVPRAGERGERCVYIEGNGQAIILVQFNLDLWRKQIYFDCRSCKENCNSEYFQNPGGI